VIGGAETRARRIGWSFWSQPLTFSKVPPRLRNAPARVLEVDTLQLPLQVPRSTLKTRWKYSFPPTSAVMVSPLSPEHLTKTSTEGMVFLYQSPSNQPLTHLQLRKSLWKHTTTSSQTPVLPSSTTIKPKRRPRMARHYQTLSGTATRSPAQRHFRRCSSTKCLTHSTKPNQLTAMF
jgi:hypothetical protein